MLVNLTPQYGHANDLPAPRRVGDRYDMRASDPGTAVPVAIGWSQGARAWTCPHTSVPVVAAADSEQGRPMRRPV